MQEENHTRPVEGEGELSTESNVTGQEEAASLSVAELELERLRYESRDYKDKYLRLLAESDNARKRLQKEKQELIQYAIQNVILDILDPVDHLENALKFANQGSEEVRNWSFGFQMILEQFKDVLARNGVSSMDAVGKVFDPHLHEAIEMIETEDHPPGVIVEESLRGYLQGGKTLRAARVKVAKKPIKN